MAVAPKQKLHAHPELCRDCQPCVLACSLYHERRCGPSLARLAIVKDMARYTFGVRICQHCENPACMAACPTGALAADGRDVVVLDQDACIQCGACEDACPHDAIVYVESDGRYLKCDLCAGREGPLCVEVCPVEAITFGEG